MARAVDGVDDNISTGATIWNTNVPMTFVCWVNGTYGNGLFGSAMMSLTTTISNTFGNSNDIIIGWENADNLIRFVKEAGTVDITFSTDSFLGSQWEFFVLTWDGTNTTTAVKIYRGYKGSFNEANYVQATTGTAIGSTGRPFRLGVRGNLVDDFTGSFGPTLFYSGAVLPIHQIEQFMWYSTNTFSLKSDIFWPFHGFSSPEYSLQKPGYSGTLNGTTKSLGNPPINGFFTIPTPQIVAF